MERSAARPPSSQRRRGQEKKNHRFPAEAERTLCGSFVFCFRLKGRHWSLWSSPFLSHFLRPIDARVSKNGQLRQRARVGFLGKKEASPTLEGFPPLAALYSVLRTREGFSEQVRFTAENKQSKQTTSRSKLIGNLWIATARARVTSLRRTHQPPPPSHAL